MLFVLLIGLRPLVIYFCDELQFVYIWSLSINVAQDPFLDSCKFITVSPFLPQLPYFTFFLKSKVKK